MAQLVHQNVKENAEDQYGGKKGNWMLKETGRNWPWISHIMVLRSFWV